MKTVSLAVLPQSPWQPSLPRGLDRTGKACMYACILRSPARPADRKWQIRVQGVADRIVGDLLPGSTGWYWRAKLYASREPKRLFLIYSFFTCLGAPCYCCCFSIILPEARCPWPSAPEVRTSLVLFSAASSPAYREREATLQSTAAGCGQHTAVSAGQPVSKIPRGFGVGAGWFACVRQSCSIADANLDCREQARKCPLHFAC